MNRSMSFQNIVWIEDPIQYNHNAMAVMVGSIDKYIDWYCTDLIIMIIQ